MLCLVKNVRVLGSGDGFYVVLVCLCDFDLCRWPAMGDRSCLPERGRTIGAVKYAFPAEALQSARGSGVDLRTRMKKMPKHEANSPASAYLLRVLRANSRKINEPHGESANQGRKGEEGGRKVGNVFLFASSIENEKL